MTTDVHALPEVASDERMHALDASCWCHPKVEVIAPTSRAVIHSEDDPLADHFPTEEE